MFIALLLVAVHPEWNQLQRLPREAFTGDVVVRFKDGVERLNLDRNALVTDARGGIFMAADRVIVAPKRKNEARVSLRAATKSELWSVLEKLQERDDVDLVFPTLRVITADSYVQQQAYREAAPLGVGANSSGSNALGQGVRIGSVEGGWNLAHEDLPNCLDLGTYQTEQSDHGTAVLGEIFGLPNGVGVTGLAHEAICQVASWNVSATAQDASAAIRAHMRTMSRGDVIFIAGQVPGPNALMEFARDERGYVPMDYDPTYRAVIAEAVASGIVVVLAAGNGGENLDLPEFEQYRSRSRQAGAIIVGAGSSPVSGAEGRERMSFSTYGSRVDLQGLGQFVTTTGYGDADASESDPNRFYTYRFAGTSSATPIVAGVVAAIQSHLIAQGREPLSPESMRTLLIETGSPQTGNTSEHIGPYPNLSQAIAAVDATYVATAQPPAVFAPTSPEPEADAATPSVDDPMRKPEPTQTVKQSVPTTTPAEPAGCNGARGLPWCFVSLLLLLCPRSRKRASA